MTLRFVPLDEARAAQGLRLVLLQGVPSPWSQAAKALVELDRVDALGVWMPAADPEISAWSGTPNGPVAMYAAEPARSGWAQILTLIERLSPQPCMIPPDPEQRVRMFGLCHELMGEQGLIWNSRLLGIDASLASDGARGYALPVARYLGARYGHSPGCGEGARQRMLEQLSFFDRELERSSGPYYMGDVPRAVDVYSAAVIDAIELLPEADSPMHPGLRRALESQRELLGAALPTRVLKHRDLMHERHIPLPLVTGP